MQTHGAQELQVRGSADLRTLQTYRPKDLQTYRPTDADPQTRRPADPQTRRPVDPWKCRPADKRDMASLPTNIVGFRGFDSSIMLFLRGGILRPKGDFLESLSHAMLVGTMLVGRLGVHAPKHTRERAWICTVRRTDVPLQTRHTCMFTCIDTAMQGHASTYIWAHYLYVCIYIYIYTQGHYYL